MTATAILFENNSQFFPTPKALVKKMWKKIPEKDRLHANYILEPSAGTGNIAKYVQNFYDRSYHRPTIHVIEKDSVLIDILRGRRATLIDYDFLTFSGNDKYDIIIANPPFNAGEHHLMKAIDILYCGHIVFLLNAETLRNPHTTIRKKLVQRLEELEADVEYLADEFIQAERKTAVDVALVHIHVKREIEQDLFEGVTDAKQGDPGEAHKQREVMEKESIRGLVADYDRAVKIGTEVLLDFYRNYHHVSPFLSLLVGKDEPSRNFRPDEEKLTVLMKDKLNQLLVSIRKHYWEEALKLDVVEWRMTWKQRKVFHAQLQDNALMDFTEANIRTFILNLVKSYEEILTEAVLEVFDEMTIKYAWDPELHNKTVHYFDGWKTTKAFYVNKKVIMRMHGSYGGPFQGYGGWKLDYDVAHQLGDIDKVMNYFDGRAYYYSIAEALENAFKQGKSSGIESTYFKITVYKKGTIHLTFLNEDIRRRFNITACRGKNWLPQDYGRKFYKTMATEEQQVVDAFEGREKYDRNVNVAPNLFYVKDRIQIGCDNVAPFPETADAATDKIYAKGQLKMFS
jgi:hypothetical protein